MKNPSSVRYYLLTGAATAALLCPFTAIAETSGSTSDEPAVIQDWHISPVTENKNRQPYCALSARFAGGVILTNTRNRDGKGSLAVEFPNVKFQADQLYRIDLKIGENGLSRSYAAKAVKENMIVVKIGNDPELFASFDKGENITVMLEKGKAVFPLHGHEKSFYELEYCVKALPVVPTAITAEETAKPEPADASPTAPSVPLENSVYTKKIAPPTLDEKFKKDNEKRIAATRKLQPIPMDGTAAEKSPAPAIASAPEKTPAVLKSGYTSDKKRIYEPETPNEDISEEQRTASLKSTLEKARAKAMKMDAGTPVAEDTAQAQAESESIKTADASVREPAPKKAPVAAAPVKEPAAPAVVPVQEVKQEPVTVPPVAFNTVPAAPQQKAEKPAEPAAAPVPAPVPAPAPSVENPAEKPVAASVPAPVIAEKEDIIVPPPAVSAPAPAPVQTSVPVAPAAFAPAVPAAVNHTIDFTSLPPKTFSVSPWEVELVTDKTEKPYCLLSSEFDNGVKLFLSRSSDGLSTLGIDFGVDLLETGRSYQTVPAVENVYEKQFVAKAESPRLLVAQIGNQDELFAAVQTNGAFVVSIPGAVINFDTSSALQSADAFAGCLGKINTALQAPPAPVTAPNAVASEPVGAPSGEDKYRAPYVRTSAPAPAAPVHTAKSEKEKLKNQAQPAETPDNIKTAPMPPADEPLPVIYDTSVPPSDNKPAAADKAAAVSSSPAAAAPTSITEQPKQLTENETTVVPAVPPEPAVAEVKQPAVENVPVTTEQEVPVAAEAEDPAVAALNSLVERNRADFAENMKQKNMPKNSVRIQPAPRKLETDAQNGPITYTRISAPKTSDILKSSGSSTDSAFIGKTASDIALIDSTVSRDAVSAPVAKNFFGGQSAFFGKSVYPAKDILKASGINGNIRATSAGKSSYEWINDATGIKGELKMIPNVTSIDNVDYLLELQDNDATSCKGNFSFELGAENTYKIGSVMTADSICTDPLNASSSAYLLHFDGKALYRWRFSGEVPTALMIERNRISAAIDADAKISGN